MTTQSLHYFIQVYECGSLSTAAAKIHITPQGLSKTIKQIELEYGVELFSREANGLVATPQGQLMYRKGKEVLNILGDLEKSFKTMDREEREIGFVISQKAAHMIPPNDLFLYQGTDQHLQVKIKEVASGIEVEQMIRKHYDFGIVVSDEESYQGFHKEEIMTGELIAKVPPNHYLSQREAISLDTLRGADIVLCCMDERDKQVFIEKCLERGFVPHIRQEFMTYEAAVELAMKHQYILITSDMMDSDQKATSLKSLHMFPEIKQNLYLIYDHRIEETDSTMGIKAFLKSTNKRQMAV